MSASPATASSSIQERAAKHRQELDAHAYEIVQWHFHPSTGCPFWLEKKRELKFDPLTEVKSRVTIESGPLHDSFPRLALCPRCTESLEAWFYKRHHRSSNHGSGSGHSRSQRHHAPSFGGPDPSSVIEGRLHDSRTPVILLGVIVLTMLVGIALFALVDAF